MVLDRKEAPAINPITHFDLPQAQAHVLSNGAKLFSLHTGKQAVVGLEIILNNGTLNEPVNGVSFFTAKLMAEGTARHNSRSIADFMAQYGAFFEVQAGVERTSLMVYSLSKFIPEILPLLAEMIQEAIFPEEELVNLKNISLQQVRVNLQKTAYMASVQFKKTVLGKAHPGSAVLTEETIAAIDRDMLLSHYQKTIATQPFEIIIAGDCNDAVMKAIDNTLGQISFSQPLHKPAVPPSEPLFKHVQQIPKQGSVQASVRVGRPLFDRRHPDYLAMRVLNEIFGGYFGSRLMKNIREEKGFTYGIYSSLAPMANAGYMIIGADVNKNVAQQTIDEIYKEMEILATEPIPADELETVRNYMLGAFANSINTPFALAEKFKTIYFDDLEYGYYNLYINKILTITAEELLATAHKYYTPSVMTEIVAGGD